MYKIRFPLLSFLLALLCVAGNISGQDNTPSEKKTIHANKSDMVTSADQELAQEYFNEGKYDACVKLVDSLKTGVSYFSKQAKEDLFILKIKALLEEDKIHEAEDAAKELFRFDPHYSLDLINNNTEDYNRLIQSIDVHPLLSLGVRNSVLMPSFSIKQVYTDRPWLNYNEPLNYAKYFLMYYAWAEYQFSEKMTINMELVYWTMNYSRTLVGSSNDLHVVYNESMKFFETPVYLKRYLLVPVFKNILPYVCTGFSYLRLTSATASASSYSYTSPSLYNGGINVLPMRNQNTFEWLWGAGLGYKIKNLRIFLDYRYYGGINSFTNENQRTAVTLLSSGYGYIDSKTVMGKSEMGASISLTFKNSVSKRKATKYNSVVQFF
jgi:hypothetical protein